MSKLKEINKYLLSKGQDINKIKEIENHSVYLSMVIADYAHRNQTREDGEMYFAHPYRCLNLYRDWVGIIPNDYFCIDIDLMHKYKIPFDGVQEVCLLHDVIEDSELTLEDVEEIFEEIGFAQHFKECIKDPLIRITHIKSMDYLEYIKICIGNPISAIVKFMDLQDNLNILTLVKFDEAKLHRAERYLSYMYLINAVHKFTENIIQYRQEFMRQHITEVGDVIHSLIDNVDRKK